MIAFSLDTSVPAPCHKEARNDLPAGARASDIVEVVAWIKCRVVAVLQVPRVGVTRANRGAVFTLRSLERLDFAHEGLKNEEARITSNTTTICASKDLLAALQRGIAWHLPNDRIILRAHELSRCSSPLAQRSVTGPLYPSVASFTKPCNGQVFPLWIVENGSAPASPGATLSAPVPMLLVALGLQISPVSMVCGNVFGFAWIPEFINGDWLFMVVCNMSVSRQGTSGRDEAVM